jgi:hypothetical protein
MVILPGNNTSWTRNPARTVYSAGNYQLRDKESTGGMGFRRELPAQGQGIHGRNRIQPGITRSNMRNSSDEWDFAITCSF